MATDLPDQSPGTSSAPRAVEEELLAVARNWAQTILANKAARIAASVTQDRVMVFDTGVFPGERFLALIASRAWTRAAMDVLGPLRVRVPEATAILTSSPDGHRHRQGGWPDAAGCGRRRPRPRRDRLSDQGRTSSRCAR